MVENRQWSKIGCVRISVISFRDLKFFKGSQSTGQQFLLSVLTLKCKKKNPSEILPFGMLLVNYSVSERETKKNVLLLLLLLDHMYWH